MSDIKEGNSKKGFEWGMKYSELVWRFPIPNLYWTKHSTIIELTGRWNNKSLLTLVTSRDIATQLQDAMNEIYALNRHYFGGDVNNLWCNGSFCNRKVRGRDEYSVHAWGLAVDINAHLAPFHQTSHQPDFIVSTMKKYGFLWGGDYPKPYIDGMHFSAIREGC
jgi:hypothetical protein